MSANSPATAAALFASGVVLAVWLSAYPAGALAQATGGEAASEAAPADQAAAKDGAEKAPDQKASAAGGVTSERTPLFEFNAGELALLRRLAVRRRELDEREAALVERERLAAALETKLVQQSIELKRVRAALAKEEERARKESEVVDEAAVERVQNLAKAYKSMKSQDAARLFNAMEMELLVLVAREISPRTLAPVIAKMQPEKAQELSIALADRRQ